MSLDNFKKGKKGKGKEEDIPLDFGIKVTNEEEMVDLSSFEKYNLNELEVDSEITGKPFITYFEGNEGDNYESLRLQLINEKDEEVVNIYCNIPLGYPVIKTLRRNNNFMKNTYNFILGVFNADPNLDDTIFYDNDGKPMNTIKEINLEALVKYVNKKKSMKIKVIENGDYNSFSILGLN